MLPLYLMVFQLTSLFTDFEIIMKIGGLLYIVSFVKQHIQDPLFSNIAILGLSAFLLFDVWKIFGSALFLYILVSFQVLHTIVDLSFMHGFAKKPSKEEMQRANAQQMRQAEYERDSQEREMMERAEENRRAGGSHEYGGEESDHGSHMYSRGAANAHQGHGGAHSLSRVTPQQVQQMLHSRGHGGGRR